MSSLLGTPRAIAPYLILDTLAASGWSVSIAAADAGVCVRATHSLHGETVEQVGEDVGSVALVLATKCARVARAESQP